jgi:hypothetical protein
LDLVKNLIFICCLIAVCHGRVSGDVFGLHPDLDPDWISQGAVISLTPTVSGSLYMMRVPIELANYLGYTTLNENRLARYAATTVNVTAGQPASLPTSGLRSGFYDFVLVRNGAVEATKRVHLAFSRIPVSPHYEVSVEMNGKITSLSTYTSYRDEVYVRDFGVDGKGNITFFNASGQPVNAHSWAGISTRDYPIVVRVKVLPAAGNTYFDGSDGISFPIESARVLPSSYDIPCRIEGSDTIVFTLDRPRKVMVIPNYEKAMKVYEDLAVGHTPLSSFEDRYESRNEIPDGFNADRASNEISEGYKNPLVFLGREPDTFPADLGFSKDASDTLVVRPGDRPTQEALSAARVVWFEPGTHDLSRLGEFPSYRTYIEAGQIFYLEEGAFVAAGFKRDEESGPEDCYLVGRGVVSGINHFWGGGNYVINSLSVEVDIVDGLNFVDRAMWGIDGGDLINDIALMGAWHGNCDGLDSLDHCTVLDSFLMAHDDNLKLNDHTYAENLVIYMLGTNAHPIMFKEMWDDVVFANAVVKDVDIVGYWKNSYSGADGWHRITPGAIACMQTRNVSIQNALFSDIRIESPHVSRVFSFYNLYSGGENWPYVPDWLDINNANNHSRIDGLVFENITVTTPLISWRSLFGSGFADSFANLSFANIFVNGVQVTEENMSEHVEISGYVNGTDPADGGTQRRDIADPVRNIVFHDTLLASWSTRQPFTTGLTGDEDADGISNLLEFAFGGDPWDPGSSGQLPYCDLESGQFSFVYPVLDFPNTGLTYSVESSTNLRSWESADLSPELLEKGEGLQMFKVSIPIDSRDSWFYRLRIGE